MPLTSNTFYLSNAEYVEKKKRVSVEFSNLNETRRISFPFIPYIILHKSLLDKSFFDFLKKKKLKTEKITNGFKVFSSDFSFLEKVNSFFEKKGILLPSETQFLLLKNWSFFDGFELNENNEFEKKGFIEFPELKPEFSYNSLKENVSEMLSFSDTSGKNFLNKIILSNVLCLKLNYLNVSKSSMLDSFIELILFRNNFAFNKSKPKFDSGFIKKYSGKLKEIDFSFVWPVLFSFPFHNLGFDSVNCSCCKPKEFNERNILPSSLIEVKFNEDAIYFESSNTDWSSFFHEKALGKEKRIKRMNEWRLRNIPSGPFFRNDVLRIPLNDALKLKEEEKIVFLNDHNLVWSCTKKECFISKELTELNKKTVLFDKKINELESGSIKDNGIAFSLFLEKNPEFHFFSEYKNVLKTIFSSVPFHLSSHSSAFFDFVLSNSIKSVFSSVLTKFREFSVSNSSPSFITKKGVLVDSDNPLDLLTEFSKNQNIPVPELSIKN